MLAKVYSGAVFGVEAFPVEIEGFLSVAFVTGGKSSKGSIDMSQMGQSTRFHPYTPGAQTLESMVDSHVCPACVTRAPLA